MVLILISENGKVGCGKNWFFKKPKETLPNISSRHGPGAGSGDGFFYVSRIFPKKAIFFGFFSEFFVFESSSFLGHKKKKKRKKISCDRALLISVGCGEQSKRYGRDKGRGTRGERGTPQKGGGGEDPSEGEGGEDPSEEVVPSESARLSKSKMPTTQVSQGQLL